MIFWLVAFGAVAWSQIVNDTDANLLDQCLQDATDAACVDVRLTTARANAALDSLCEEMPWMAGCTVQRMCARTDVRSKVYCSSMSLLADICLAGQVFEDFLSVSVLTLRQIPEWEKWLAVQSTKHCVALKEASLSSARKRRRCHTCLAR